MKDTLYSDVQNYKAGFILHVKWAKKQSLLKLLNAHGNDSTLEIAKLRCDQ